MKFQVTRQVKAPARLVLYGPEGVGKTTFGAESENPIFVCTEDGATAVPVDKFTFSNGRLKAETWDEFIQALEAVTTGEHDYKTLVIDTWNYAVSMASKHVCDTQFGGKWTDPSHGFLAWGGNQGWPATIEELKPALILFDRCRDRGMMVILLAHDGTQSVRNPIQGDYNRFAGDMDKRVWNACAQWADLVGHADYKYTVVETKDAGGNVKRGRAMGGNVREIRWHGTAAEAAKNRVGYEMPETTPLTYASFRANVGRDTYTLNAVIELWPILTKDEAAKALTWLGTEKLNDAPVIKLRPLLTRLQAKAAEVQPTNDTNSEEKTDDAE